MVRKVGSRVGAVNPPQVAHLLPSTLHELFVLADAQLLSVHDACPLGPRSVTVIGMLLHVHLRETGLLLVVRLLLRVGHGLPTST